MNKRNQVIADYREKFRDTLGKGSFTKREYKQRIKCTYKNLRKYVDNFYSVFGVYWLNCSELNKDRLRSILERGRIIELCERGSTPTINEIYYMFKFLNLEKEFRQYLIMKTHFSYSLDVGNPREIVIDPIGNIAHATHKTPVYYKFAEFVYIILSEYIVLHNYMWSSKLKPKQIATIDKWMKEF